MARWGGWAQSVCNASVHHEVYPCAAKLCAVKSRMKQGAGDKKGES